MPYIYENWTVRKIRMQMDLIKKATEWTGRSLSGNGSMWHHYTLMGLELKRRARPEPFHGINKLSLRELRELEEDTRVT